MRFLKSIQKPRQKDIILKLRDFLANPMCDGVSTRVFKAVLDFIL